jgi:hypothetical protein
VYPGEAVRAVGYRWHLRAETVGEWLRARHQACRGLLWLDSAGYGVGPKTCALFAGMGEGYYLRRTRALGVAWDALTCARAASSGNLPLLRWARQAGCPWDHRVCAYAEQAGHFHVQGWAHLRGCYCSHIRRERDRPRQCAVDTARRAASQAARAASAAKAVAVQALKATKRAGRAAERAEKRWRWA